MNFQDYMTFTGKFYQVPEVVALIANMGQKTALRTIAKLFHCLTRVCKNSPYITREDWIKADLNKALIRDGILVLGDGVYMPCSAIMDINIATPPDNEKHNPPVCSESQIEQKQQLRPLDTELNQTIFLSSSSIPSSSLKYIVHTVINALNETTGSKFRLNNQNAAKLIGARIRVEKATLEDFLHIIKVKNASWKGTNMEAYLRPSTLFCSKHFEEYLNEKMPEDPNSLITTKGAAILDDIWSGMKTDVKEQGLA